MHLGVAPPGAVYFSVFERKRAAWRDCDVCPAALPGLREAILRYKKWSKVPANPIPNLNLDEEHRSQRQVQTGWVHYGE